MGLARKNGKEEGRTDLCCRALLALQCLLSVLGWDDLFPDIWSN